MLDQVSTSHAIYTNVDGKVALFLSSSEAGALNTKLFHFCFLDFSSLDALYKYFSLHQGISILSAQKTHELTPGTKRWLELSSSTVAICTAMSSLKLILQNIMQVFSGGLVWVFFQPSTFQILILIQKQKVEKWISLPTLEQYLHPLVSPQAMLKIMSELWAENMNVNPKGRVIIGRLPLFPKKEENKNPSNQTVFMWS